MFVKWEKFGGDGSLLKIFYSNMPDFSLDFEILLAAFKIKIILEQMHVQDKVIVVERSLWSQLHGFVRLHEEYTDPVIMDVMRNTIKNYISYIENIDKEFLYLFVPSEVCMERILSRERDGEENIGIEYLEAIEKNHDEYFVHNGETVCCDGGEGYETLISMIERE